MEKLDTQKDILSVYNMLFRQYNSELIKRGLGFTRKELKQKDRIDLRDICTYKQILPGSFHDSMKIPDIKKEDIKDDYMKKNYWYNHIPCFNEGVMQLNDNRYIYWNIKELNVNEQSLTVFIQDYVGMNGRWDVGVRGTIKYKFAEDSYRKVSISILEYQLFSDLYTCIPYKELGWNDNEIQIWKKLAVENALSAEKKMVENKTNNVHQMSAVFTHFILFANQALYYNKPKAIRSENKERAKRKIIIDSDKEQPKKLVRSVGGIKMISQKPPKMPTEETVVHYKTAVWKARGGVRHMKDGRIIPFKESIRRRKCLMDKVQEVPQSIIKIQK